MKKGWEIKKIGEVCDVIGGGTPSKDNIEFYDGDIFWATVRDMKGDIIKNTEHKITKEAVKKSSTNVIPKGNVIIATRVGLGKICLIENDTAINQDLRGVIPKKESVLQVGYLFQWFKSISHLIIEEGTGATVQGVKLPFIKDLKIPIPPLQEQKQIVSILDSAFSAIAKAKANAEQNLKNAKELFESYLQRVFENKGDGWEEKTLKELTTHLGDGLHGTPKYSTEGDYYFINGNNLTDGVIEFKESTKRVSLEEYNKYKKNLTERTVFVSINGTLGNVAFYNDEKIILGKSACYFNLKESVDKNFIRYVLSSPYFLNYAHKEATGATIKNVSLKTMREFLVPIPSIEKQQTIVQKLDTLSIETKKLESIYQQKIADLEELKKSLLQKAFNGELKTESACA